MTRGAGHDRVRHSRWVLVVIAIIAIVAFAGKYRTVERNRKWLQQL
jgi:type VI protein secretion system component VasF